jgi:hypothetical protein
VYVSCILTMGRILCFDSDIKYRSRIFISFVIFLCSFLVMYFHGLHVSHSLVGVSVWSCGLGSIYSTSTTGFSLLYVFPLRCMYDIMGYLKYDYV